MVTPTLQLRDLGCVRGGRELFSGLSLDISGGRLLRVAGANGAGKTSLLRMVCGLLLPTRGEVLWRGTQIAVLREEFHRQLVYLGHVAALKDDLSALENLLAAGRLCGLNPSEREASAALLATGLRGHERLPVRRLSQGQRRRVALARLVLGSEAGLWVLDEPFNALDAAASAWLLHVLATHVGRGGIVVLTSHDPALALPQHLPQSAIAL
jgi:heme exporter protein A